MKYLLIDGNNLAIRNLFANQGMQNSMGMHSGVHYGFFQSLISLSKRFHEHQILIAWDSSSKRRKEESKSAVEQGLIKAAYKENRRKDEAPEALQDFFDHGHMLKQAIAQVGIPQILIGGYEADDVIASYVNVLSQNSDNEIVMVTSDKDYLQLLRENAWIWDGMKVEDVDKKITLESFKEEYKIEPHQMIDVGALMGDVSDNIFGVPGCGMSTSLKEIQKHGTCQNVLDFYKEKHKDAIVKYKTLKEEDWETFVSYFKTHVLDIKTKTGKDKYPEVYSDLPNSGLLIALEKKEINACKNEIMMLVFENRIKLAYSLKKMDLDISPLPEIKMGGKDKEKLEEYLEFFDIKTLDYEVLF